MQRKKKLFAFYGMLALSLIAFVLRAVDLHYFTDHETGFAAGGSVWMRYIPMLLLAVLSYALSHFASQQPRELVHRCTPLGVCMMLTGTALAAVGLADISPLMERGATALQYVECLLPLAAAVWFWRFSARAFVGPTGRGNETPSAITGVLPLAYFVWLLIRRFAVEPAALVRIGNTVRVLGAAAALLFIPPLLKIFMAPGETNGHALFATGVNVFLLGSCCELMQTAYGLYYGRVTVDSLLESVAVASLGLCGIVCAWYAVGSDMAKKKSDTAPKTT